MDNEYLSLCLIFLRKHDNLLTFSIKLMNKRVSVFKCRILEIRNVYRILFDCSTFKYSRTSFSNYFSRLSKPYRKFNHKLCNFLPRKANFWCVWCCVSNKVWSVSLRNRKTTQQSRFCDLVFLTRKSQDLHKKGRIQKNNNKNKNINTLFLWWI